MRIHLDRFITIEQPTVVNTKGSPATTFSTYCDCWAMIDFGGGSTGEEDQTRKTVNKVDVYVRYDNNIKPKFQLYETSDTATVYTIIGVKEHVRRKYLVLECETRY